MPIQKRPRKNHYASTAPGATATITTKAAIINATVINAISATLPRLAGNFPRRIQYWLSTKRWNPTKRTTTATAIKVVPKGFPRLLRRPEFSVIPNEGSRRSSLLSCFVPGSLLLWLKRKSWVTAIPIDANASDVLNQARNVLSGLKVN